jgi:hypothetical protein
MEMSKANIPRLTTDERNLLEAHSKKLFDQAVKLGLLVCKLKLNPPTTSSDLQGIKTDIENARLLPATQDELVSVCCLIETQTKANTNLSLKSVDILRKAIESQTNTRCDVARELHDFYLFGKLEEDSSIPDLKKLADEIILLSSLSKSFGFRLVD